MKIRLSTLIVSICIATCLPLTNAIADRESINDFQDSYTVTPDASSLPSLENASDSDIVDALKEYVTVGNQLVSAFESLITNYESVLINFRDYRNDCSGSPQLGNDYGSRFQEARKRTCSNSALSSLQNRLRSLGGELDQLEGQLGQVKEKIIFANSEIKNMAKYTYVENLISNSEEKMNEAINLKKRADKAENGG